MFSGKIIEIHIVVCARYVFLTKQNKYEKRHLVAWLKCYVDNDLHISYVKIAPSNDSYTVGSHGLQSMVIFIGSWNRKRRVASFLCSSLTWESPNGLTLVNILRTIWTFLNGTIRLYYRKVVGVSLTLPKPDNVMG